MADASDATGMRVVRLHVGRLATRTIVREAARALQDAGFVAVRGAVRVPPGIRRAVARRHVVLFADAGERTRDGRDGIVRWIRVLASTSSRAHLLVLIERHEVELRRPGRREAGAARRPVERVDRWIVRERAVAHTACHRGDALQWRDHDAWVDESTARLVREGELRRAESLLRGLAAEAAVRGEAVPPWMRVRQAELCFWRGRFVEAAAFLNRASTACPESSAWQSLIEWAAGAAPGLDPERIGVSLRAGLVNAAMAQQRLADGDAAGALRLAESKRRGTPAALEQAVLDRIAEGCRFALGAGDATCRRTLQMFVSRTGARGIWRWGIGREEMNLLHGLSALLEVVQEAEDECAALRHGCSWVREQASAESAAIVAIDGARLIAGEGVSQADLHDPDLQAVVTGGRPRVVASGANATVAAPVRYGGATIGFVIARGRPEAAESLTGAAKALAAVCAPAVRARLDSLALSAASRTLVPEILGRSPGMATLREAIARAATTSFPVLIEGESGTGKELVARAVHRLSARRDRRFSAVNCAALPEDLLEAELFGHARGAFTGALHDRPGLFEESDGSTMFLDEVADLSARGQAKLLRVLQEREIRRVGEHRPRRVDVRVVAATNVSLVQAVGAGRFREDLLFRLAVIRLHVPALRDRVEDVPLLAQTFWRAVTAETGTQAILSADATAALCRQRWPGNVRELQNVIAGLALVAPARGRVGARHVAQVLAGFTSDSATAADVTLTRARQALESRMIAAALARHAGRASRAARELGLSRQGLAKAMKRLGMQGEPRRARLVH